jgi:hypothetical protein
MPVNSNLSTPESENNTRPVVPIELNVQDYASMASNEQFSSKCHLSLDIEL